MAQGKNTREYIKVRDLIEKIDKSLQDMAAELQELVQKVAGWEDCPPVGDYYGEDYDFYNGEDLRILELSQTIRVRVLLKQAVAVELGVLRRKPRAVQEDQAVRRVLVRAVAQIFQSALGKSLNAMTCVMLDEYEIETPGNWRSGQRQLHFPGNDN